MVGDPIGPAFSAATVERSRDRAGRIRDIQHNLLT